MVTLPVLLLRTSRPDASEVSTPVRSTAPRRERHRGQALGVGVLLTLQFLGAVIVTVIALVALLVNVLVWIGRALTPPRASGPSRAGAAGGGRRRQVFTGSS